MGGKFKDSLASVSHVCDAYVLADDGVRIAAVNRVALQEDVFSLLNKLSSLSGPINHRRLQSRQKEGTLIFILAPVAEVLFLLAEQVSSSARCHWP